MKQVNKLTALILSVAMVLQVGMPTVFAIEDTDMNSRIITSFSAPEQEEYELTIGASQEEIDELLTSFPKTLTAQVEVETQDIVIGESTEGDHVDKDPSFGENQPEASGWEQENEDEEEQQEEILPSEDKTAKQTEQANTANVTRAEMAVILERFVEVLIMGGSSEGWMCNDSGKWMYYENGKAVTGKKKIDGKTYTFNNDGVVAEETKSKESASKPVSKVNTSGKLSIKNILLNLFSSRK